MMAQTNCLSTLNCMKKIQRVLQEMMLLDGMYKTLILAGNNRSQLNLNGSAIYQVSIRPVAHIHILIRTHMLFLHVFIGITMVTLRQLIIMYEKLDNMIQSR